MKASKDLVVVMCPPYPEYQEKPADHSESRLINCPMCNEKMWLSNKKEFYLMFSSYSGKEILLGCYNCITKEFEENTPIGEELVKVEL